MRALPLVLLAVLGVLPASAQAAGSDPPQAPASGAVTGLRVTLELGGSGLDREALRAALEREVRVPVTLIEPSAAEQGASVLLVRVTGGQASVSHTDGRGRTVSRVVEIPEEPARAVEVIALLAGNVARNEAEELLLALGVVATSSPARAGEEAPPPSGDGPPRPPETGKPAEPRTAPKAPPEKREARARAPRPAGAVNLSLWHPVALVPDAERRRVHLDLALAYGRSQDLEGGAFSFGHERVDRSTEGFLGALLWTHAGGPADGAELSGVLATASSDLRGASVGGAVAWREGAVRGAQVGGALALARDVEGVQLAGAVSVARDVHGFQGAGGVSVARKVRGVQLAVVNIAEEVEGAGIGLVSIAGNGRVQPVAWFATTSGAAAGVKFIAGSFYSNLGASLETDGDHASIFAGMGPHIALGPAFIEAGVDWHSRQDLRDTTSEAQNDLHYRAKVGVEPASSLSLFAGAGLRHAEPGASGGSLDPEFLAGVSVF